VLFPLNIWIRAIPVCAVGRMVTSVFDLVSRRTGQGTAPSLIPGSSPRDAVFCVKNPERRGTDPKAFIFPFLWLIVLTLTGYPAAGYSWNVVPPDPVLIKALPGPHIVPESDELGAPAVYSFSGLALSTGTVKVDAEYVGPDGTRERTFEVTVEIVPSMPTTSTLPTTTTESTTTTTTKPPTTTSPPTTTTTAAPTATTTASPTTTTTIPRTTTTIAPNTVYIDERYDGQFVHVPYGYRLVLTLGGNPSAGYDWRISKHYPDVMVPQGDPVWHPAYATDGSPGVWVWTFALPKMGSSPLELEYVDVKVGKAIDLFYVGVIVDVPPMTAIPAR